MVLPRPGGAVNNHVIQRFAAYLGGLNGDAEVVFHMGLPNKIIQAPRPQRYVYVVGLAFAGDQPLRHVVALHKTPINNAAAKLSMQALIE